MAKILEPNPWQRWIAEGVHPAQIISHITSVSNHIITWVLEISSNPEDTRDTDLRLYTTAMPGQDVDSQHLEVLALIAGVDLDRNPTAKELASMIVGRIVDAEVVDNMVIRAYRRRTT